MNWKSNKLSEISLIGDGAHASLKRTNSGIPYLTAKNITKSGIDYSNMDYISEETYNKYFKKASNALTQPKENDVLYSIIGSIGGVYVVRDEKIGISSSVAIFRSNDNIVLPKYLAYFLKSPLFESQIQAIKSGVAQSFMSLGKLGTVSISYPDDILYQNKLVKILSTYDNLIENNQKQIKLLEEAAQRLYKEWFVDLRFPGHESTKIIDGIPEGWAVKSILDNNIFIFVKSKVAPFEGKKQYFATADINGTILDSKGEAITYTNRPSRANVQPIINSVWFARMSNTYKILNCFGENSHLAYDSVISSGFAGFTATEGCYGFVYETIASIKFNDEKKRYATGATQVSLTNTGLKNIKLLMPTIDIATQYSKVVEPFMLKAELLKKNCKLLQEARDRLLPKLVNGELEV